jgi:hypothetical protein
VMWTAADIKEFETVTPLGSLEGELHKLFK